MGVPPLGASAGRSTTRSGSRVTSAKGPEPTGRSPNEWSGRLVTGTSASRWAGAMGWVAACRNPPIGVSRVNRTVRSPMACTVTPDQDVERGPA